MPEVVIINTSPLQYLFQLGLGLLLKAKQVGRVESIKPHIARLELLGFRLDASTRASVLRLASES